MTGLDALRLIGSEDPDLLITEIDLPVLDGLGLIEAVRSTATGASLPIICIASTSRADDIAKLAEYGISDFVLKPASPKDLFDRVRRVLARNARWRSRADRDAQDLLLFVDSDPHFTAFAEQILARSFDVLTATNGMEAAAIYADATLKPGVVVCAENLKIINETALAQVIRNLAIEQGADLPSMYLLSEAEQVPEAKARVFAAVLRRSFVPDVFTAEIRRHISHELSTFERVELLWRGDVRNWLSSAMRESLGVMLGREARAIARAEADAGADMVAARIRLTIDDVDVPLYLEVACESLVTSLLATSILGEPTTFEDGGSDVLGELANMVAGRVMSTLAEHGFKVRNALPSTSRAAAGNGPPDESELFFHTPEVGTFGVRLLLGDSGPVPSGLQAPEPPRPSKRESSSVPIIEEMSTGDAPSHLTGAAFS
jgi:DNA-binding response OmpR family regulator